MHHIVKTDYSWTVDQEISATIEVSMVVYTLCV